MGLVLYLQANRRSDCENTVGAYYSPTAVRKTLFQLFFFSNPRSVRSFILEGEEALYKVFAVVGRHRVDVEWLWAVAADMAGFTATIAT